MATNSSTTSKPSPGVSYLQIHKSWLKNDRDRNGNSTIPAEVIWDQLFLLLTKAEYQMVDKKEKDEKKLKKLFIDILPSKGEQGFNKLIKILFDINCDGLANVLLKEKEKLSRTDCSNEQPGDVVPTKKICLINHTSSLQNPQMKAVQAHLSRLIKKNVDFMAKYWSDVIRVAKTEAAFVQVQVLEHFKSKNGNPVNSFNEVFDKDGKTIHEQILIQADPGCGKTTYVNKLALDWANQDEYLRSKFDFVFLIELKELAMSVDDTIKTFLPEESKRFFKSYAESTESKILLILDGFDELQETSQWYPDVTNILEGKSSQFQFFNILLTSRRSHIDKIPNKGRGQCLLIKGFSEQSMKQFLDKQHVPLPSVGQQSNLSHLFQTPLFCAIYCSLYFGGGDPIELEDSYDLIKALVENSVKNTVKKKTVVNEKEQLNEIGKFAFQMLDSSTLDFVVELCRSSEEINPSFDLSSVNLDLLIKRTTPTRGDGAFKEKSCLPHQLIAEYLAARYFARSLTEEQLEQIGASELIHDFTYHVQNLPFVRFFLFELLFLYLEKKYEQSVFDNFLNVPALRFIWNIKSNTDISTLDNVSDLNFYGWHSELLNHSRFIPTLSKCQNLSSMRLYNCGLSKNQVEQLVNFINNNCLQKIIELYLGLNENVGSTPQLFTALSKCKDLQRLQLYNCEMTVESTTELAVCIDNNGLANLTQLKLGKNENVGSTPQLFTALSKCKHLEVLQLRKCNLSVESTTELARCIANNGLANLKDLDLSRNENIGSSTHLFHVLHKCRQLQELEVVRCSMTQESLNILLWTFNPNNFQQLIIISLVRNEEIKVDDNFFIALEKSPKVSEVCLDRSMESDLSEVGRKAKEKLKERGCKLRFHLS